MLLKVAKAIKRYKVTEMKTADLVSSTSLEGFNTNRKITKDNVKVEWLNIRWIQVSKDKPGIMRFK